MNKNSLWGEITGQITYQAFFRVSLALLCLTQIFGYAKDFDAIYSGKIIPLDLMLAGVGSVDVLLQAALLSLHYTFGVDSVFFALKSLYLFSLFFLLIGFATRATAIVAFLCNYCLFYGQELFCYGYDGFISNSLLFCCIFSINNNFSLDQILFHSRESTNLSPPEQNMLRSTLRITLCVVYVFSGLSKAFDGAGWWNGEKMLAALHFNVTKSSLDTIDLLSKFPALLVISGIAILFVEVLYPIFINYKLTRKYMLAMTIGMHVLIAIFLGLTAFSAIMIIWNITAYANFEDLKTPSAIGSSVLLPHSMSS